MNVKVDVVVVVLKLLPKCLGSDRWSIRLCWGFEHVYDCMFRWKDYVLVGWGFVIVLLPKVGLKNV